jgi:hypothetical protein
MKKKTYRIENVSYCNLNLIPDTCSFCKNEPIGYLTITRFFTTRRRWICNDCRLKWIKGDLEA